MSKLTEARRVKLYEQRRKPNTWKNSATSPWTPERVQIMADMWKAGKSCRQIAIELGNGITRNAVIGKVHRENLPARRSNPPKTNRRYRPKGATTPKPKKAIKGFRPGVQLPVLPESMPGDLEALKGHAWAALPSTSPKPLLALDKGCRWPIGEERPYLFCGEALHKGVYCKAHASIAFVSVGKVKLKPVGKFKDSRVLDEEFA